MDRLNKEDTRIMKTKKTIRKLSSPLARDLARLSRDLHSMRKRIDSLTDKVEDQNFENKALRKEVSALRGKAMPQSAALESAKEVAELFDDDTCTCGHKEDEHRNSISAPRMCTRCLCPGYSREEKKA